MKHALITLMGLISFTAQAAFFSGNDLLNRLNQETSNPNAYILAQGYIVGVVDAYDDVLFCIPKEVRVGQLVDMTKNNLRNRPDARHSTVASAYVVTALSAAFPCPKQEPQWHQERY